ncbi:MAG: efflux RND transporter periplasmic adaptor subunit [Candidatus Nomurabacteria bacterium]|nr:efflux RND transporter periplasmic adaptor subunit [Candidatus Nomurabacteria bacterium]
MVKNLLGKIKSFFIAHKTISIIIIIILLVVGYYSYKKITDTSGQIKYITTTVQKGTIIASITGSGQVSVSNQIDIKPKVSGQIMWIGVNSGDKVNTGQALLSIDSTDAQKSVRDAQVALDSANLSLEKLKLQNSDSNLNNSLSKAYSDGLSVVSSTFSDITSEMIGLNNMLLQQNLSYNTVHVNGPTAVAYRTKTDDSYYQTQNLFEKISKDFAVISLSSNGSDIENIINETYQITQVFNDTLKDAKIFVDYIAQDTGKSSDFSGYQTTLSDYLTTMNNHFSSLGSIKTNIQNSKDTFQSSDLDIQSAQLSVTQKENALQDAKDKLADYTIRAPFSGLVSVINVKVGDTASSSSVASIVTNSQLAQISLNEVDVAKIQLGQKATITFDAIPDLSITGKVTQIDTVGTVTSGVVNYTVKISFDTQDNRIKPGMSVSADIITDVKTDALLVPNSAVKTKGGVSYVQMFTPPLVGSDNNSAGILSLTLPEQVTVQTGLSNDTSTEITSGIIEGDQVVLKTVTASTAVTTTPSLLNAIGGNRAGGAGGGTRALRAN